MEFSDNSNNIPTRDKRLTNKKKRRMIGIDFGVVGQYIPIDHSLIVT